MMKVDLKPSSNCLRKLVLLPALVLGFLMTVGCEQDGPAERAGENVDEAVEESGDALERAGDNIEDAME